MPSLSSRPLALLAPGTAFAAGALAAPHGATAESAPRKGQLPQPPASISIGRFRVIALVTGHSEWARPG